MGALALVASHLGRRGTHGGSPVNVCRPTNELIHTPRRPRLGGELLPACGIKPDRKPRASACAALPAHPHVPKRLSICSPQPSLVRCPALQAEPQRPPGDGSHPHALTLVTQPHKQLATSSPFSLHRSSPRRDTKASGLVPPPPLQPSDPGGSSRKCRPAHRDPRLQVPRWLPGAPSMKAKPLGVAPWSCGADLTPARPHPAGSVPRPPHRHTPATPAPSSPSKSQATSALSALSW